LKPASLSDTPASIGTLLLLVAHNANMIHCLSVLLFEVRMQMEYWYPSMLSYSMFSLTPSSNRDPASIIETRLLFLIPPSPPSIGDPACIWDPASIRGFTVF